ncbi:MAG: LPS assembly lipoprotein LptE [Pseudomonadales bacterium]
MLFVCLLMLGSAGCGFHLRSWDVGSSVETVHVAANARNPMQAPLEQALQQAGVELVARSAGPTLVVELLDARQERRNISVSGQARAAEYEAVLGVRYRITDGAGNELIPARWLERERVFRVDRDNLVGSSEEQALLEREMRSDLVQQILRAVNAVAPEPAAPKPAAPEPAAPEPAGAG